LDFDIYHVGDMAFIAHTHAFRRQPSRRPYLAEEQKRRKAFLYCSNDYSVVRYSYMRSEEEIYFDTIIITPIGDIALFVHCMQTRGLMWGRDKGALLVVQCSDMKRTPPSPNYHPLTAVCSFSPAPKHMTRLGVLEMLRVFVRVRTSERESWGRGGEGRSGEDVGGA
jgi:hypothetical protein